MDPFTSHKTVSLTVNAPRNFSLPESPYVSWTPRVRGGKPPFNQFVNSFLEGGCKNILHAFYCKF